MSFDTVYNAALLKKILKEHFPHFIDANGNIDFKGHQLRDIIHLLDRYKKDNDFYGTSDKFRQMILILDNIPQEYINEEGVFDFQRYQSESPAARLRKIISDDLPRYTNDDGIIDAKKYHSSALFNDSKNLLREYCPDLISYKNNQIDLTDCSLHDVADCINESIERLDPIDRKLNGIKKFISKHFPIFVDESNNLHFGKKPLAALLKEVNTRHTLHQEQIKNLHTAQDQLYAHFREALYKDKQGIIRFNSESKSDIQQKTKIIQNCFREFHNSRGDLEKRLTAKTILTTTYAYKKEHVTYLERLYELYRASSNRYAEEVNKHITQNAADPFQPKLMAALPDLYSLQQFLKADTIQEHTKTMLVLGKKSPMDHFKLNFRISFVEAMSKAHPDMDITTLAQNYSSTFHNLFHHHEEDYMNKLRYIVDHDSDFFKGNEKLSKSLRHKHQSPLKNMANMNMPERIAVLAKSLADRAVLECQMKHDNHFEGGNIERGLSITFDREAIALNLDYAGFCIERLQRTAANILISLKSGEQPTKQEYKKLVRYKNALHMSLIDFGDDRWSNMTHRVSDYADNRNPVHYFNITAAGLAKQLTDLKLHDFLSKNDRFHALLDNLKSFQQSAIAYQDNILYNTTWDKDYVKFHKAIDKIITATMNKKNINGLQSLTVIESAEPKLLHRRIQQYHALLTPHQQKMFNNVHRYYITCLRMVQNLESLESINNAKKHNILDYLKITNTQDADGKNNIKKFINDAVRLEKQVQRDMKAHQQRYYSQQAKDNILFSYHQFKTMQAKLDGKNAPSSQHLALDLLKLRHQTLDYRVALWDKETTATNRYHAFESTIQKLSHALGTTANMDKIDEKQPKKLIAGAKEAHIPTAIKLHLIVKKFANNYREIATKIIGKKELQTFLKHVRTLPSKHPVKQITMDTLLHIKVAKEKENTSMHPSKTELPKGKNPDAIKTVIDSSLKEANDFTSGHDIIGKRNKHKINSPSMEENKVFHFLAPEHRKNYGKTGHSNLNDSQKNKILLNGKFVSPLNTAFQSPNKKIARSPKKATPLPYKGTTRILGGTGIDHFYFTTNENIQFSYQDYDVASISKNFTAIHDSLINITPFQQEMADLLSKALNAAAIASSDKQRYMWVEKSRTIKERISNILEGGFKNYLTCIEKRILFSMKEQETSPKALAKELRILLHSLGVSLSNIDNKTTKYKGGLNIEYNKTHRKVPIFKNIDTKHMDLHLSIANPQQFTLYSLILREYGISLSRKIKALESSDQYPETIKKKVKLLFIKEIGTIFFENNMNFPDKKFLNQEYRDIIVSNNTYLQDIQTKELMPKKEYTSFHTTKEFAYAGANASDYQMRLAQALLDVLTKTTYQCTEKQKNKWVNSNISFEEKINIIFSDEIMKSFENLNAVLVDGLSDETMHNLTLAKELRIFIHSFVNSMHNIETKSLEALGFDKILHRHSAKQEPIFWPLNTMDLYTHVNTLDQQSFALYKTLFQSNIVRLVNKIHTLETYPNDMPLEAKQQLLQAPLAAKPEMIRTARMFFTQHSNEHTQELFKEINRQCNDFTKNSKNTVVTNKKTGHNSNNSNGNNGPTKLEKRAVGNNTLSGNKHHPNRGKPAIIIGDGGKAGIAGALPPDPRHQLQSALYSAISDMGASMRTIKKLMHLYASDQAVHRFIHTHLLRMASRSRPVISDIDRESPSALRDVLPHKQRHNIITKTLHHLAPSERLRLKAALKRLSLSMKRVHLGFKAYIGKVRAQGSYSGMNPMRERMLDGAEMLVTMMAQNGTIRSLLHIDATKLTGKQQRAIDDGLNLLTGYACGFTASMVSMHAGIPIEAVYAKMRVGLSQRLAQSSLLEARLIAPYVEKALAAGIDPIAVRLIPHMKAASMIKGAGAFAVVATGLYILYEMTDYDDVVNGYLRGDYSYGDAGVKLAANFAEKIVLFGMWMQQNWQGAEDGLTSFYHKLMGTPITKQWINGYLTMNSYEALSKEDQRKIKLDRIVMDIKPEHYGEYFHSQHPEDLATRTPLLYRGKPTRMASIDIVDGVIAAEIPQKNLARIGKNFSICLEPTLSYHHLKVDKKTSFYVINRTSHQKIALTSKGHYGFILPKDKAVFIKRYTNGHNVITGQTDHHASDQLSGLMLMPKKSVPTAEQAKAGWRRLSSMRPRGGMYGPVKGDDVLSMHIGQDGKVLSARLHAGLIRFR